MKNAKRADEMMRKAKRDIGQYLTEMGVSSEMVGKAHSQDEVYEVPFDQQLSWKLVTGVIEDHDFTEPGACKSRPAPENCVTRETTD